MSEGGQLRLPGFIGVGPVRTGTTWLDTLFRGHLGLPERIKETQFFGWRYNQGFAWYARHFRNCPSDRVIGEFGPTYFFDQAARERIARDLPGCKVICTLRDPVDRIYSHYKLWRKLAILKRPFAEEIKHNPMLFERMEYASHVREWMRIFGPANTLILIYEDSRVNRQEYVDRICDFIGASRLDLRRVPHERRAVAHFERVPRYRRLARCARELKDSLEVRDYLRLRNLLDPMLEWCMGGGEPFPPLEPELEAGLRARCLPDIEELENLLGRDLSIWKRPLASAQSAAAS